jgi:hypothetical protein
MRGAIPPLPQYVLMAWCLVKHRDNFTIYLLPFHLISSLYFHLSSFLLHFSLSPLSLTTVQLFKEPRMSIARFPERAAIVLEPKNQYHVHTVGSSELD